jgi:hypothetical protein
MLLKDAPHNQGRTGQHVADRKRHYGLRCAKPRQVMVEQLIRGVACPGMDCQRDVQLLRRVPQRLVEVVLELVLPDGDRIDIDAKII